MNCKAHTHAGVCGFQTTVNAESPDDQNVTLTIETDCEKIAACAVPVGIFKCVQVAARVALPKDVAISLSAD